MKKIFKSFQGLVITKVILIAGIAWTQERLQTEKVWSIDFIQGHPPAETGTPNFFIVSERRAARFCSHACCTACASFVNEDFASPYSIPVFCLKKSGFSKPENPFPF